MEYLVIGVILFFGGLGSIYIVVQWAVDDSKTGKRIREIRRILENEQEKQNKLR